MNICEKYIIVFLLLSVYENSEIFSSEERSARSYEASSSVNHEKNLLN